MLRGQAVWIALLLFCGFVAVGTSFSLLNQSLRQSAWVTHTEKARGQILSVLSVLQDAETGQRGYILTGNRAYLEPYTVATTETAARVDRLLATIDDNPVQVERALEIRQLASQKLAELDETVERRAAGDLEGAMTIIRSDHGKNTMDAIRIQTDAMLAEEARLLALRQQEMMDAAKKGRLLIGFSSILALVLTVSVGANMHRHQRQLQDSALKARKADESKSRFLATMSHEIRTPMNGMLGVVELLHDTDLDPNQRKLAAILQDSATNLLVILNDILDVSRLSAGKVQLSPVPFDLREMTDNCAALFRADCQEKLIELRIEVGPNVPPMWIGDDVRIRQILINLLSNAVKFTANGEVSLRAEEADGGLRFVVSDSGIGMSEHALSRVFQPFTQADAGMTRLFGGTGLGLSICRELATLMQGSIVAESEEGRGSTFSLWLPLVPSPEPKASVVKADAPGAFRHHVLIVDDDAVNTTIASAHMKKLGCSFATASNGLEAVVAVRDSDRAFDVILMDVMMPILDGLAASRQIRAHEAEHGLSPTPIIALSANALPEDREQSLSAGMDDHLTKPIMRAQLLQVLTRYAPHSS